MRLKNTLARNGTAASWASRKKNCSWRTIHGTANYSRLKDVYAGKVAFPLFFMLNKNFEQLQNVKYFI